VKEGDVLEELGKDTAGIQNRRMNLFPGHK
jgi:hypothetical protein